MDKKVVGSICRNVVYLPPPKDVDFDLHLAKVIEVLDDGSTRPAVKLYKDYKRTFWVCNRDHRHHKQKKERVPVDWCQEIKCSQMNLRKEAAQALGYKPQFVKWEEWEDIVRGPYTYGSDLSSASELKFRYNNRKEAQGIQLGGTVAAFDVETNIRDRNRWEWIEVASLTYKDKVITAIDKHFLQEKYPNMTVDDMYKRLYQADGVYLNEINQERKIQQEFVICDSEIEVLQTVFAKAHEWMPDFIVAWNMDYDINRTIEACQRADYPIEDLLSHPTVPKPFRMFKYYPGRDSMITKKGTWRNLSNFEKWPQVTVAASFTFVDSMCYYYGNRKHKGKEPSYSLDAILTKEFPDTVREGASPKEIEKARHNSLIRKLKFEETNTLVGTVDWHIQMQSKYPFEYVIYNKFDCIALEYLDEQTMDISFSLVSDCETCEYKDYESEPRRLACDMHWINLEDGYAYGTGGKNNEIELDKRLIGRDDWIVTLRADLLVKQGKNHFKDARKLITFIFRENADIDVTSSYPKSNSTLNTSRETLVKELISIEGVSERDRRDCGINLSGGFVNAMEISKRLYSAPDVYQVLDYYDEDVMATTD